MQPRAVLTSCIGLLYDAFKMLGGELRELHGLAMVRPIRNEDVFEVMLPTDKVRQTFKSQVLKQLMCRVVLQAGEALRH